MRSEHLRTGADTTGTGSQSLTISSGTFCLFTHSVYLHILFIYELNKNTLLQDFRIEKVEKGEQTVAHRSIVAFRAIDRWTRQAQAGRRSLMKQVQ